MALWRSMVLCIYLMSWYVQAADSVIPARCSSPLKIDGHMDEAAWKTAQEYTFSRGLDGKPTGYETKFLMAYDEYALYLGITCYEPQMDQLLDTVKKRDGGLWNDDSVEIFLNPHPLKSYLHLIVNPSGVIYDSLDHGSTSNNDWNALGIEAVGIKMQTTWNLEVKIPWAEAYAICGKDKEKISAASWCFNIVRNRHAGGKWMISTFAPLRNFAETVSYASLTGMDYKCEKFFWYIYNFTPGKIKPLNDKLELELSVSADNRTGNMKLILLAEDFGDKVKTPDPQKTVIDNSQTVCVKNTVCFPANGSYNARISIHDTKSNLLAVTTVPFEVTYNPLQLEIVKPFYRAAIYATMNLQTLHLLVRSDCDLPADTPCHVSLLNAEKTKIAVEKEYKLSDVLGKEFAFPIPSLVPGKWICRAEIKGKTPIAAETVLMAYPSAPTEIRVDEFNNLLVNGKEKFLIGSIHDYWNSALGLSHGETIDFSLIYQPTYDFLNEPERKQQLLEDIRNKHYRMIYPETYELWTHIYSPASKLALKPLPPENAEKIGAAVKRYNEISTIFAWYLADEPIPARHLPLYLEQVASVVRQNDPFRPCFISFNNGNVVKTYNKAFDICAIHIFPGYRSNGTAVLPLATFGDHIKLAVGGVNNKKPVYAGIPLTPYAPGCISRMPTYNENRCLAYLAIVNGAKGIFWNTTIDIVADIENRIGVPAITLELRKLEKVFLVLNTVEIPISGKHTEKVQTLGKILDGQLYVIVVNTVSDDTDVSIRIPETWENLYELSADKAKHKVMNGNIPLRLSSYDVRIFSSSPDAPILTSATDIRKSFIETHNKFKLAGNQSYYGLGTTVRYSSHYVNSTPDLDKVLIDGYKELYPRFRRKTAGDAWIEICFPQETTLSRVEVSWQPNPNTMPQPEFKIFYGLNKIIPLTSRVKNESNGISTQAVVFSSIKTKTLKFVFPGTLKTPVPSEIQTFEK